MTDYKRMISYMYQYENGVKKSNVGYARIEAKSGQCKITLHMQLLGQSDSVFPTYLIHRYDNHLELIYMGDSLLKNQVMDSKLTSDEASIMSTGYSLSDMGGLLIFLNNNIFFASEWDDKPIVVSELLEAMKPKNKTKSGNPATEDVNAMSIAGKKNSTAAAEKVVLPDTEPQPETADTLYGMSEALSLEEELKIPKYKLPRGWKTIEILQRPIPTQESSLMDNVINSAELEQEQQSQQNQQPEESLNNDSSRQQEENAQEENDTPVAKHLFDYFPKIYPFEDNEILSCVKIEPKDIGLLPKEIWSFSNNSFLMHGFYCYHHLIFAKMKGVKDKDFIYILGIPGIFHSREQFMARMFGFENFKSIRKRELKQGDFGYWYLQINF